MSFTNTKSGKTNQLYLFAQCEPTTFKRHFILCLHNLRCDIEKNMAMKFWQVDK